MIWPGEVELHITTLLNLVIALELTSVVRSNGNEAFRAASDHLNHPLISGLFCSGRKLPDHHVSGFTIYDRRDAGLVNTVNGIHLPMPCFQTLIGLLRTLVDHGFISQAAATVILSISFPTLLSSTSQMGV